MADPDQIVARITESLRRAAPPDWSRIQSTVLMTSSIQQFDLSVRLRAGDFARVETPAPAKRDFASLRDEMYEDGKGTWFSASLTIEPNNSHEITFNYEDAPNWQPPIPPMAFVQDLADYPRDDASVPLWLRAKIEEALPGQGGVAPER